MGAWLSLHFIGPVLFILSYGYEKLKKRKKEKNLIESQKGSMDKFVISNKRNITQNLDENITN